MRRQLSLNVRASRIKLLALDVDGVLTDGGVYVIENGLEFRRFNIKDGLGIKLIREHGLIVSVISSARPTSALHRMSQLGVTEVFLGVDDKLRTVVGLCDRYDVHLDQVAFIGDDLPDLPVMERVGLGCAPEDAVQEIREVAHYVSRFAGGYGAVRDVCELIIRERNSNEPTNDVTT